MDAYQYVKQNLFILYPDKSTDLILEDLLKENPQIKSGAIFDLLIQAQAIQHKATCIITKNKKDFLLQNAAEIVDPWEI